MLIFNKNTLLIHTFGAVAVPVYRSFVQETSAFYRFLHIPDFDITTMPATIITMRKLPTSIGISISAI